MCEGSPNSSHITNPRWSLSLLISVVSHALILGLLAGFGERGSPVRMPPIVEATWSDPPKEVVLEIPPAVELPSLAGIGEDRAQFERWGHESLHQNPLEWPLTDLPVFLQVGRGDPAAKTEHPSPQHAEGKPEGRGTSLGSAPGFFGIKPPSEGRVVFVVDGSRSMNHPHESELKTRFRRMKFELLKCISEMHGEQWFYVIFFSNETLPMPAPGLQPARAGVREFYLQWIGQVDSGGSPTDPRQALRLALQLQPDVIFFLTDGEFPPGVKRQLESLRQTRVIIHTFAFGETLGEETLKILAANNRGEYRFVP